MPIKFVKNNSVKVVRGKIIYGQKRKQTRLSQGHAKSSLQRLRCPSKPNF